jgi:hypothetical protein
MLGIVDEVRLRARHGHDGLPHTGKVRAAGVPGIQQNAIADMVGRRSGYARRRGAKGTRYCTSHRCQFGESRAGGENQRFSVRPPCNQSVPGSAQQNRQ